LGLKHQQVKFAFLLLLLNAMAYCQTSPQQDWANLQKYREANVPLRILPPASIPAVFMGDSITEFWSVNDSSFFADAKYVNRGISGQTTPQMILRFKPDVIDLKPARVVILAGINDIAENTGPITIDEIFANIVTMIKLAQTNKIKVILCSVLPANEFPWRAGMQPAEKVISLNDKLKTYAAKNNIVYVDYYSAMVDENKGLDKRFTEDGVHPNAEGYQTMKSILQPFLK
jgi:lysophospholipase L1-like esterase